RSSSLDSFHVTTLDGQNINPQSDRALLDFLQNTVKNSAGATLYLPVIREAVEALTAERLVSRDNTLRKAIVFVTDGAPEDAADFEKARELAATLPGRDIRLYILLFGR